MVASVDVVLHGEGVDSVQVCMSAGDSGWLSGGQVFIVLVSVVVAFVCAVICSVCTGTHPCLSSFC